MLVVCVTSDDGPCPDMACATLGHVCNLRLTGDFYCQCVTDCVTRLETDKSNNDLFALFVIPIVVIVSLLALLVLLLHKKRHKVMKTVNDAFRISFTRTKHLTSYTYQFTAGREFRHRPHGDDASLQWGYGGAAPVGSRVRALIMGSEAPESAFCKLIHETK